MKRRYSHTARDRFKPFLCWSHTAAFEDSLLRKIESCPTFGFHVRPTDHKKLSPVLSAKPALQRQFNCSGKTLLRNSAALISEQRRISCCFLFSFFFCVFAFSKRNLPRAFWILIFLSSNLAHYDSLTIYIFLFNKKCKGAFCFLLRSCGYQRRRNVFIKNLDLCFYSEKNIYVGLVNIWEHTSSHKNKYTPCIIYISPDKLIEQLVHVFVLFGRIITDINIHCLTRPHLKTSTFFYLFTSWVLWVVFYFHRSTIQYTL